MYFLKFLSNFIEKSLKRLVKNAIESIPDADLKLLKMKTISPSCPSEGVHMYGYFMMNGGQDGHFMINGGQGGVS